MAKIKDIINKRFGRLIVIDLSIDRGNRGQIKYNCVCDCGNKHEVTGESLRSGRSRSCGCLSRDRIPYNRIVDREYAAFRQLYNSTIKKRSIKDNYITDISLDKFIEISKSPCYYCGLLSSNTTKDRIKSSTYVLKTNGLDRVDSNLGYLCSNVVSCCRYCNFAKNTMTQDEFRDFVIRLYNNFINKT